MSWSLEFVRSLEDSETVKGYKLSSSVPRALCCQLPSQQIKDR